MSCSLCNARGHTKRTCPKAEKKVRYACSVCNSIEHTKRNCPEVDPSTLVPRTENGGRPREHSYPEVFSDLNQAPKQPLDRERWAQEIIARLIVETLQGRGSLSINQQVVALINTMNRIGGREQILDAADKLRGDKFKTKPKPSGPETQIAAVGSKPIR